MRFVEENPIRSVFSHSAKIRDFVCFLSGFALVMPYFTFKVRRKVLEFYSEKKKKKKKKKKTFV